MSFIENDMSLRSLRRFGLHSTECGKSHLSMAVSKTSPSSQNISAATGGVPAEPLKDGQR